VNILGIDPGLRLTGFACLSCHDDGADTADDTRLLDMGVIRLTQRRSIADRLVELEIDLLEIIERHAPSVVGVEKVFAHKHHPATASIMGHARGVVLLVARRKGCRVVEFAPSVIKRSLTGNGVAKKAQMQRAVALQFRLAASPEPADIADAIAIALCAARRVEPVIMG
jgi:crossover junction endodeoxyribonuclease RuvC